MQDAFKLFDRGGIPDNGGPQRVAIDRAIPDGAGERSLDTPDGTAALRLDLVHGGVGVEDGDARALERGGGGGLPHSDPAREPNDFQPGTVIDRKSVV